MEHLKRGYTRAVRTSSWAAASQPVMTHQDRARALEFFGLEHRRAPFGIVRERWYEKSGTRRDSQRGRLYRAEQSVRIPMKEPTLSLPECEAVARRALSIAYGLRGGAVRVELRDGRGCRVARGDGGRLSSVLMVRLTLPLWARTRTVVLHETAHAVQAGLGFLGDYPAHGRIFARVFLDLVRAGMGRDAFQALRSAFRAGKVRYVARRAATRGAADFPARAAACRKETSQ